MSEPSYKSQSAQARTTNDAFRDGWAETFGDRKPQRGTWYFRDGKSYTPEEWAALKAAEPPENNGRVAVVSDLYMDGVRATDGTDIGSRAKRREYMKAHNLADADDFKGEWEKAAKEREAFFRGEAPDPGLREAIGRAAYQVEQTQRGRR